MDYADYDIAETEVSDLESTASPLRSKAAIAGPPCRQAVVAVVEDGIWMSHELSTVCEFLDVAVVRVPSDCDLGAVLKKRSPMAVVCEMDGIGQDGCHVMKMVAKHDANLPVLLITGADSALIGAAEAVEEIWRLTEVRKLSALPGLAGLVDFLFHAGRKGGCLRHKPAKGGSS